MAFPSVSRRQAGGNVNQTKVHILAADGLVAVNADEVFAGFDRGFSFLCEREGIITRDVAAVPERQHAIDVNLGVFIVIKPSLPVYAIRGGGTQSEGDGFP